MVGDRGVARELAASPTLQNRGRLCVNDARAAGGDHRDKRQLARETG